MKTKMFLWTALIGGSLCIIIPNAYASFTHPARHSSHPEAITGATSFSNGRQDINTFVKQKYPGCRILDKDYDDGLLEVKIRHKGTEKIMLFYNGKWLRTLWEIRREQLPKRVVSALADIGYDFRHLDDNDNMAIDTPKGHYYAVQAERNDRDGIYIVSDKGRIAHRYTSDSWNDGRIYEEHWSQERWEDDGEDRFDEGDDEWDDQRGRGKYKGEDDGEDHFDEGDDEW